MGSSAADVGSRAVRAAGGPGTAGHLGERLALGAFIAYLAIAWSVLVFGIGAHRWFFRDDWSFLTERDGGNLSDVFRPQGDHPSAVPVLVFRVMYNAFGLWFTPYLVLIVTLHLGVVALSRVIMRRAGAGPWVSTAAAGALALFGPGQENILWVTQINYVSSILLGLTQLVLMDHDGAKRRRDALGALAGVGAVMSSGIGPILVLAVGLATLARRGWRAALVQTAVPAVVYATWYGVTRPPDGSSSRPPAAELWRWVRSGETGTVNALGQSPVAATLISVVLVGGLALLFASAPLSDLRRRVAAPMALLACGPVLFAVISQGRWQMGPVSARSSRYLYVALVLLLPALAVAADAIARRWRPAAWLVVLLLVVGVPGSIDQFGTTYFGRSFFDYQRQLVLGLPTSDLADQVPGWVHPLPFSQIDPNALTVGWLRDAREDGRLPEPGELDPDVVATFPILLGLARVDATGGTVTCNDETTPVNLSLVRGDRVVVRSRVFVSTAAQGVPTSPELLLLPHPGGTLSVELPALELRFSPARRGGSFTLCR